MALVGDDFYVADSDAIMKFPYHAGDTKITAAGVKLADLPAGTRNHHWTEDFAASPDRSRLYATVGTSSNVGENASRRRPIAPSSRSRSCDRRVARIRVGPAQSERAVVGAGERRDVGRGNERDELGNDLVPDYMTSVKDGAFYGWPCSYYGRMSTSASTAAAGPGGESDCAGLRAGGGYGFAWLTFNTGHLFPPEMAGGAFVGQHGSWNRSLAPATR